MFALKLVLSVAVAGLWAPGSASAGAPAFEEAPSTPPRLLVVLSIDQLRTDDLLRLQPLLSDDGLGRLLADGAFFEEARTRHAATEGSPGHVAIATGCLPGRAGIPNEHWFDQHTRKYVGCVDDTTAYTVSTVEESTNLNVSARRLERPTFGDLLQAHVGEEALVLSFAYRPQTALLLAGREADGAYFIDPWSGTWITSSAVRFDLPEWLSKLNELGAVARYEGRTWKRSFPEEIGEEFAGPDDDPAEPPFASGRTFPYELPERLAKRKLRKELANTPFGDRVVMDAVLAALEDEPLGADDVPDVLMISLAALAECGIRFGPDSQETMDVLLQADQRVAELMRALDQHVGGGRWTLAVTSNHGVAPLPSKTGALSLTSTDLVLPVEMGLRERYPDFAIKDRRAWLLGLAAPWLFVSEEVADLAGVAIEDASRTAAELLEEVPGVAEAIAWVDLPRHEDPEIAALAADRHPERTGQVFIRFDEHVVVNAGVGTNHGSQYDYDRRVPLLFYGAGVSAGRFAAEASPMDVVPTLARLVDLPVPDDLDGRALDEALRNDG